MHYLFRLQHNLKNGPGACRAAWGQSTVSNLYDSRSAAGTSFGFGVQTLYKLDKHWQWSASLQYSRDGYKTSLTSNPFILEPGLLGFDQLSFTQTEIANMLRLPLQLRYNWLSPAKKVRPYIYLGGDL